MLEKSTSGMRSSRGVTLSSRGRTFVHGPQAATLSFEDQASEKMIRHHLKKITLTLTIPQRLSGVPSELSLLRGTSDERSKLP